MLTVLRRVALALALVLPTTAIASPIQYDYPAAPEPYDAVVKVVTDTGHGTGFILGGKTIVTAAHVTKRASSVTIMLSNGATVRGAVVATDSRSDVAVIEAGKFLDRSSRLRCEAPHMGEAIRATGYLLDIGRVVMPGEVGGTATKVGRWISAVPVGIPIGQGMSGGPIYGEDNEVVGIGVAFVTAGYATGVALIVPGDEVCRVARAYQ